jgi:hypothetical protein
MFQRTKLVAIVTVRCCMIDVHSYESLAVVLELQVSSNISFM